MPALIVLRDLVILLAVAIPVAAIAHRARLSTVTGFLLVGVAIGPHGFALISRPVIVTELAELGVSIFLFLLGIRTVESNVIRITRR